MAIKEKKTNIDSGLRGKFNGELYVDKKIFFKRNDVKKVVNSLKNSISLREHIQHNKHELKIN
jgi:hypothetical protein